MVKFNLRSSEFVVISDEDKSSKVLIGKLLMDPGSGKWWFQDLSKHRMLHPNEILALADKIRGLAP